MKIYQLAERGETASFRRSRMKTHTSLAPKKRTRCNTKSFWHHQQISTIAADPKLANPPKPIEYPKSIYHIVYQNLSFNEQKFSETGFIFHGYRTTSNALRFTCRRTLSLRVLINELPTPSLKLSSDSLPPAFWTFCQNVDSTLFGHCSLKKQDSIPHNGKSIQRGRLCAVVH